MGLVENHKTQTCDTKHPPHARNLEDQDAVKKLPTEITV